MSTQPLVFCVVVDDEPLAQQVLEIYIQRMEDLKLIAKCENIEEAFEVLTSNHVDVMFLDLDLKSASGVDIIDQIKKSPTHRYYIIITSAAPPKDLNIKQIFDTENIVFIDYLRKPFSFDHFKTAIQKLAELRKTDDGC